MGRSLQTRSIVSVLVRYLVGHVGELFRFVIVFA